MIHDRQELVGTAAWCWMNGTRSGTPSSKKVRACTIVKVNDKTAQVRLSDGSVIVRRWRWIEVRP